MAAPKSRYRYLTGGGNSPMMNSDSLFELDESDVWNSARSASPEFRNPVPAARRKPSSAAKRSEAAAASSLPVNVPDWSKILKEDYNKDGRLWDSDGGGDDDVCVGGGGSWVPPHEFLARTRMASFSVHEGAGRTLKGRDLRRVRNAIWEKTGFQD